MSIYKFGAEYFVSLPGPLFISGLRGKYLKIFHVRGLMQALGLIILLQTT